VEGGFSIQEVRDAVEGKQRKGMVGVSNRQISRRRQGQLLRISKSRLYYRAKGCSGEELGLIELIDREYLEGPGYGPRGRGHRVNRKRVQPHISYL